jgi:hypothetical protein
VASIRKNQITDKFDGLSAIDNVLEVDGSLINPVFFHPSKRAIRA